MAEYLDSEAEESLSESEDNASEEEKVVEKKKSKVQIDSDDEEEDEEEDEGNVKDLINDDVEEEDASEGEGDDGKRKHESDISDDDKLEDDDFDLIEENLGIKIKRKQKRKRIRVLSDGDSDSEKDAETGREAIANELFEGGDNEEEEGLVEMHDLKEKEKEDNVYGDISEEEEESDVDDFIVDDEGRPISKGKKKKHIIHSDAALQEAQDIFGVDFDFAEEYGDDDSDVEEDEYEEDEDAEAEGGTRARSKKTRKKKSKKTIFDLYEPADLEKAMFTDLDNEIRTADMPERFQLRSIAVQQTEDGELDMESEWIYKHAFMTLPVSMQDILGDDGIGHYDNYKRKGPSTVSKIKEALNFMRNQQLEVPFIAFYRKEYVTPELNINDLWKVWQWDEKWMQLKNRKENLIRLFEKMQSWQYEQIDVDKPMPEGMRALSEEDIDRARSIQTMEEYRDVYQHFLLYYGKDIPAMKNAAKKKDKKQEDDAEKEDGENPEEKKEDEEADQDPLKQATRKNGYHLCVQAGLGDLASKFGLTPEQFGENLRDNYQRHEVDQYPIPPQETALENECKQFSTDEEALMGARHMIAMQLSHEPLVRQCVRQTFYERAKLTLKPTKKGVKLIPEDHDCYSYKYLKNKPVKDIKGDQFLKIVQAEQDGLLQTTIHLDDTTSPTAQTYFNEIQQLFHRDEFSHNVQEWNKQRSQALERALNMILYPQFEKELKGKLIAEAKEGIIKSCTRKLYNWLKIAPYQSDVQLDEDDDDTKGTKVMGVAYDQDRDSASYAALIDGDGEVTDFMKLPCLQKIRRNTQQEGDKEKKTAEIKKLKEFILTKRPHVIAVGGESREAADVIVELTDYLRELEQDEQIAVINVELVENDLSQVYANSHRGQSTFRDYPLLLRQAVSLARRLQDPLVEFSQMCNSEEDIMGLKFHPMQDMVSKEELVNALYLEFVNRVNEVGVDLNRAVAHPHTASMAQFICGLGPRKATNLLKLLHNMRLENRMQLVTHCRMGPKCFINCAGFIKIDTNSLGDSTEAYVEVLDGSRVHPETYDWARKMAVDALDYDDTAEDANPAGALEEILESPERLKDLDLDAFAEELERQGYGNKHITLYDIRAELNHRYKDLRVAYRPPADEEKFNMLTKETPQTFYIGKLLMGRVVGVARRRPRGEQLDNANPVRNDSTGLWQCPFCQKDDFPELSEVWLHFDAGNCPGQAVGVRVRLDNGVAGFIPTRSLSDKNVTNPEDRVKWGMLLHCRITKISVDKFQVDLTSKTSDLADKENKWKLPKDTYYDFDTEDEDLKKEEDKQKVKARTTYVKRVIAHPNYYNISYRDCEKKMADMSVGDVVIRPSSKGTDHLTVTWKVDENILQHIDVREENKKNAFDLGHSLWIGSEEFEDLDEIIARHIQPMVMFAQELMNYKYYKETNGGKRDVMEKFLIDDKKKYPSKIPYYFSASKEFPGKFLLSYIPRSKCRHEYCTVNPEGIRYRGQTHSSLSSLIRWYKEHFREPIPGTPMRTPMGNTPLSMSSNPYMPGATPQIGATPQTYQTARGFSGFQQPVATPLITPSYHTSGSLATPAQSMTTPSYQPTPKSNWPGATPRNPGSTPRQHGGSTPRQHGSTPKASPRQSYSTSDGHTPRQSYSSGGQTPRQGYSSGGQTPSYRSSSGTPRQGSGTPSRYTPSGRHTPGRHTPSHHRSSGRQSASQEETDWAQAAAMWAKKKGSRTPGRATPGRATPAGDSTPLIDEK